MGTRNIQQELAGEWTFMHVPMAHKGIALCASNHAKVKSCLHDEAYADHTKWADKRVLRRVLSREFTGEKQFPRWVTIHNDEWETVSRALRGHGEKPTGVYNLFMRQLRRGGQIV